MPQCLGPKGRQAVSEHVCGPFALEPSTGHIVCVLCGAQPSPQPDSLSQMKRVRAMQGLPIYPEKGEQGGNDALRGSARTGMDSDNNREHRILDNGVSVAQPSAALSLIEEIADIVGMGKGAWDMVPDEDLGNAILEAYAAHSGSQPTAPRAELERAVDALKIRKQEIDTAREQIVSLTQELALAKVERRQYREKLSNELGGDSSIANIVRIREQRERLSHVEEALRNGKTFVESLGFQTCALKGCCGDESCAGANKWLKEVAKLEAPKEK